jgi:hypothetical protein
MLKAEDSFLFDPSIYAAVSVLNDAALDVAPIEKRRQRKVPDPVWAGKEPWIDPRRLSSLNLL